MGGEWQSTVYGEFPGDYAMNRLADLCDPESGVQTGPFGSQLHKGDYVESGTPIVTVEHLGENRIDHSDVPNVSDEDRERLSRFELLQGDIVFSRVGSVDRRALVRATEQGWLFSGRCLRVRPDSSKIDPGYLSYFFGLPSFKEHIRAIAVGATMPSLNTRLLSDVLIPYPSDTRVQRAIAHILGTLDDKIELNRRMNETLEAIARAIFKSWFVDFDPVRAKAEGREYPLEAETLALFPDGFEESELGEIPAGWRVGALGEVAENPRRSVQPDDLDSTTPYIGLEHMPQRSIALAEWGTADEVGSNKYAFLEGEFLFGKLRPYFHKVGVAPLDGICSTDVLTVVPKDKDWGSFVLGHISSAPFVDYATAVSTGTRMPRTNWGDMSKYQVPLPPARVAKVFGEITAPLVARINSSIFEAKTLAQLRDTLLPRLISGELRIPGAERIVERCV
jgi:type I restriction enzyme, S subunit